MQGSPVLQHGQSLQWKGRGKRGLEEDQLCHSQKVEHTRAERCMARTQEVKYVERFGRSFLLFADGFKLMFSIGYDSNDSKGTRPEGKGRAALRVCSDSFWIT